MAEYQSHFARLSFYVDGKRRQFSNGRYVTDDKAEIDVLDKLTDATRVDKPKKSEEKEPEKEPKKPAAPKRKPSPKKESDSSKK